MTRTADGYQPHMVSPEKGLRLMAAKALSQVEAPVAACVADVYNLLVSAAREAAAVSGENTEAAMNGKVPLNVPEFKNVIMPAVVKALDEWRRDALRMAAMLVEMEQNYITAGERGLLCGRVGVLWWWCVCVCLCRVSRVPVAVVLTLCARHPTQNKHPPHTQPPLKNRQAFSATR